jgi:ABC-type multidrug transport system fused ATPase/permease subunit
MVKLQDGKIEIDNVDISTVSLHILRTRIGFVPQDTTLFLGNLRDNLYVIVHVSPRASTSNLY